MTYSKYLLCGVNLQDCTEEFFVIKISFFKLQNCNNEFLPILKNVELYIHTHSARKKICPNVRISEKTCVRMFEIGTNATPPDHSKYWLQPIHTLLNKRKQYFVRTDGFVFFCLPTLVEPIVRFDEIKDLVIILSVKFKFKSNIEFTMQNRHWLELRDLRMHFKIHGS